MGDVRGGANRLRVLDLDHVGLNVADVGRSADFYRTVLEVEEIERPEFDFPGAWFALGPRQLHLIGKRASGDGRFRECHFSVRVRSAVEAARRLRELGIEHDGPRRRPDGAWQVNLRDPDGHSIELLEIAHRGDGPVE